jgi:hypothetical protein
MKKRKETIETQNEINNFRPIEAILLLGEPINWECSLQGILLEAKFLIKK